jgi:hypothetical protein
MDKHYPQRRLSATFVISMLAGAALVAATLTGGHERRHNVRAADASVAAVASAPQMITLERVVVIGHRGDVTGR